MCVCVWNGRMKHHGIIFLLVMTMSHYGANPMLSDTVYCAAPSFFQTHTVNQIIFSNAYKLHQQVHQRHKMHIMRSIKVVFTIKQCGNKVVKILNRTTWLSESLCIFRLSHVVFSVEAIIKMTITPFTIHQHFIDYLPKHFLYKHISGINKSI